MKRNTDSANDNNSFVAIEKIESESWIAMEQIETDSLITREQTEHDPFQVAIRKIEDGYKVAIKQIEEEALVEVNKIADELRKKESLNELKKVKARREERWHRLQERVLLEKLLMKSRLQQAIEDEDRAFTREYALFKGSPLIPYLAYSKYSKFVQISRRVVRENGIVAISNALKLNDQVSYIDCRGCKPGDVLAIINCLAKAAAVTIELDWHYDCDPDEAKRLLEALVQCRNILSLIPLPHSGSSFRETIDAKLMLSCSLRR